MFPSAPKLRITPSKQRHPTWRVPTVMIRVSARVIAGWVLFIIARFGFCGAADIKSGQLPAVKTLTPSTAPLSQLGRGDRGVVGRYNDYSHGLDMTRAVSIWVDKVLANHRWFQTSFEAVAVHQTNAQHRSSLLNHPESAIAHGLIGAFFLP